MSAPLPEIDIAINAEIWGDELPLREMSEKAVAACAKIAKLKWPLNAELSLVFTNDAEMANINKEWRDIDKPTNVLSFPGSDVKIGEQADALIGDIILTHETILREAEDQEKAFEDHLQHLMVHGFLHLFGFDHIADDEAQLMEAMEIKILEALDISNPYH